MLPLVDLGLAVRVAVTETPENTGEVSDVAALLAVVGVPADSFFVCPLLRIGLAGSASTSPR